MRLRLCVCPAVRLTSVKRWENRTVVNIVMRRRSVDAVRFLLFGRLKNIFAPKNRTGSAAAIAKESYMENSEKNARKTDERRSRRRIAAVEVESCLLCTM